MNGGTGGDRGSAGGYTGDAQGDFGGGSGGCACSIGDGGGGGGDYGGRGAGGSIDDGSCLSEQSGTLYSATGFTKAEPMLGNHYLIFPPNLSNNKV